MELKLQRVETPEELSETASYIVFDPMIERWLSASEGDQYHRTDVDTIREKFDRFIIFKLPRYV